MLGLDLNNIDKRGPRTITLTENILNEYRFSNAFRKCHIKIIFLQKYTWRLRHALSSLLKNVCWRSVFDKVLMLKHWNYWLSKQIHTDWHIICPLHLGTFDIEFEVIYTLLLMKYIFNPVMTPYIELRLYLCCISRQEMHLPFSKLSPKPDWYWWGSLPLANCCTPRKHTHRA